MRRSAFVWRVRGCDFDEWDEGAGAGPSGAADGGATGQYGAGEAAARSSSASGDAGECSGGNSAVAGGRAGGAGRYGCGQAGDLGVSAGDEPDEDGGGDCAGGRVSTSVDGEGGSDVAAWLNAHGIAAFVLRYRWG